MFIGEITKAIKKMFEPDLNPIAEDIIKALKERERELLQDAAKLLNENEALKQENGEFKKQTQRLVADFDNYKKRQQRDVEGQVYRSVQSVLTDFLPLGDNLARAQEFAGGDENILAGIEMMICAFRSALDKHGVESVLSTGMQFDASVHEALATTQSSEHAPGTIIQEFEKGYMWKGKLLRPARVVVSELQSAPTSGT